MSSDKKTLPMSEDELALIATKAILQSDGIYGLSQGIGAVIRKSLLGREQITSGVRLSKKEEGYQIDCNILVNYGTNIPACVWKLQENVKTAIEESSEAKVESVNVHVTGVRSKEGRLRENG